MGHPTESGRGTRHADCDFEMSFLIFSPSSRCRGNRSWIWHLDPVLNFCEADFQSRRLPWRRRASPSTTLDKMVGMLEMPALPSRGKSVHPGAESDEVRRCHLSNPVSARLGGFARGMSRRFSRWSPGGAGCRTSGASDSSCPTGIFWTSTGWKVGTGVWRFSAAGWREIRAIRA